MTTMAGQLDALALLEEVLFQPYALTATWLPNGQPMYFGACAACNWAANITPAPATEVHAAIRAHYREFADIPWHKPWPDRWETP